MSPAPEGYVEVAERITAFYAKYPEGSLRCKEIRTEVVDGLGTFLIYVAQAFRTADDLAPAEGAAWEPVPGKTNFTRDSELMNAETSAWGRAIAALGFEVNRGIASANEVRNRQSNDGPARATGPSVKQLDFIARLAAKHGADQADADLIRGYAAAELKGGKTGTGSKVIDRLNGDDPGEFLAAMLQAANDWQSKQSDAPGDTEDFDRPAPEHGDDIPWEPE